MLTAGPTITPSPPTSTAEGVGRLPHLPVTVFAVVMGLGGTAVAWQRASVALGDPLLVAGRAGAGYEYGWLGGAALAVVSALVAGLAGRTALAVGRGEICRPDQP